MLETTRRPGPIEESAGVADFTVLEGDPLGVDPGELRGLSVEATAVAGSVT